MKKTLALLLVLLASLQATSAFAVQATSFTYTVDDTMTLVRTQDAYLPDKTISCAVCYFARICVYFIYHGALRVRLPARQDHLQPGAQ